MMDNFPIPNKDRAVKIRSQGEAQTILSSNRDSGTEVKYLNGCSQEQIEFDGGEATVKHH